MLIVYPTTIISGNNVWKYMLESDFLASCSGKPSNFPENVRPLAENIVSL